jgi:hypothetical protein
MFRDQTNPVDAIVYVIRRLGDALGEVISPRPRPQPRLVPIPVYRGDRSGRGARRG